MALMDLHFVLNGKKRQEAINPQDTLQVLLQDRLQCRDVPAGCGKGDCGVCTVQLDGQPVYACLVMAAEISGREIKTAGGLSVDLSGKRILEAFQQYAVTLCDTCRPGLLISADALLRREKKPSQQQIREVVSGHLCRCSGYDQIIRAIDVAADRANRDQET